MKRFLSLIVLVLLTVVAWAQQISEEQALERAWLYLTNNSSSKARGLEGIADRKTTTAKVDAKGIYVFNVEGGGYVVASGDSRALPVLGYSTTGFIDWEQMPANMRAWLKNYDKAIASLGDTKDFVDGISKSREKTRAARAVIKPLIKSHWDQAEPYWNKIPLYAGANPEWEGANSYTGCVATAMAQIMNYYQWPKAACKAIPAYDIQTAYENEEKVWHIDALPAVTFDWANMLDDYYANRDIQGTAAQQDAVATLMRYCGQSIYMYYTPEFSGSDHQQVVEALVKYFGYKNSVCSKKRIFYTIDGWEDLIYNELAKGKPVQYGGDSDDGGHSFICDGYDGNGFFHINWGWSGYSDNYFSLAVLNPYNNTSAGAGSSGIGFSINQDAIIGVEPDTDGTSSQQVTPQAYLDMNLPISVLAPDTVEFHYNFVSFSYGDDEVRIDFALGAIDADGALTPIFYGDKGDSIVYNFAGNYHDVIVDSTAFESGQTMRLYPMVKFRNIPGADWQMLGSTEFNVLAGRMKNGRFFLYRELPELEIKKMEITKGIGLIGMRNDLTVTIHNASNIESTVPLYLVPYYYGKVKLEDITEETPFSEGEAMLVGCFLRAAKDTQVTYSFKPMGSGLVYLVLYTADGTALADYAIEVSDVVGSYDDFLVNESYAEMTDAYVGDYEPVAPSGTDLQLGHAVYHVSIADNTEANIPDVKPVDNTSFYACISDASEENFTEIYMEKEAVDYLNGLYANAGDGNYKFTYDLPLEIRRGGEYYVWSYFNSYIGEDEESCVGQYQSFTVEDDPSIRVVGKTALASEEPLDLEVHLNTGYPFDPDLYAGDKKVTYTLNYVKADGTLVEIASQSVPISFDNTEGNMAGVDTLRINGKFSDGTYVLRITTDVNELGPRDINITVGATGIAGVLSDDPKDNVYTDLKGVRMNSRPNRKGVYIHNGRKEVVK